MSIYLRQQWYDRRLRFDPVTENRNRSKVKLADLMWTHIWTPDVFFRNEKKANFHVVTTPNRLVFLFDDGRLWYVTK